MDEKEVVRCLHTPRFPSSVEAQTERVGGGGGGKERRGAAGGRGVRRIA